MVAKELGTSLYMVDIKKWEPIFDGDLTTKVLSLGPNKCAVSFGFNVTEKGELLENKSIVQMSTIAEPKKLTYDQLNLHFGKSKVDRQKEEGDICKCEAEDLDTLLELVKKLHAFKHDEISWFPEITPAADDFLMSVQNPTAIRMEAISTGTKSHKLVELLMRLACTVTGTYAMNNGTRLPYRGENGSAAFYAADPTRHRRLGVDAYVQVTSPLRRWSDSLAHMQIKTKLRNTTAPDEAQRGIALSKYSLWHMNEKYRTANKKMATDKNNWMRLKLWGEQDRKHKTELYSIDEDAYDKQRGVLKMYFHDYGYTLEKVAFRGDINDIEDLRDVLVKVTVGNYQLHDSVRVQLNAD